MTCTRSTDDIQALIDGTLGPIRAAELERHLDECDTCRALEDDLRRIRDARRRRSAIRSRPITSGCRSRDACARKAASTISRRWSRQRRQQYVWLAIAAALVLAVGASLVLLIPQFTGLERRPGRRSRATPPAPMPSKVA